MNHALWVSPNRPHVAYVEMLAEIVAAGGAFAGHADGGTGGVQIQLWQLINLVGAPLLAVLFAPPVIDDLKAWLGSDRGDPG